MYYYSFSPSVMALPLHQRMAILHAVWARIRREVKADLLKLVPGSFEFRDLGVLILA